MASIYDLIVKLTGDGQGLRDDLDQDKAALDELQAKIDELKDAIVKVDIEDGDGEAKLAELAAQLDELEAQRDEIQVRVNDAQAKTQLTEMAAELDALEAMRATIHVDVNDKDAQRQIDELVDSRLASAKQVLEDLAGGNGPSIVAPNGRTTLENSSAYVQGMSALIRRELEKMNGQPIEVPVKPVVDEPQAVAAQEEIHAEMEDHKPEVPVEVKVDEPTIQNAEEDLDSLRNRIKLVGFEEEKITNEGEYVFEPTGNGATQAAEQAQILHAELSRVEAQIRELDAQQIDLHGENAQREVEELNLWLDDLRAKLRDLTLNIDDVEALAKVDELKLELDSIHDKNVIVTVDEVPAGEGVAGAGAGGAGALGGAILSALPIAGPLSAAASGGVGGLMSALAPGAAGTAGFAAVATTTLKPVFAALTAIKTAEQQYQALLKNPAATNAQKLQALAQIKAATAGLDSEQIKALHSAQAFGTWWTNWAHQFQSSVVNVFTGFLGLLKNLMTELGPSIKGFASGFATLEQNASKALQSPFWRQFFSWLGANARQSTLAFGTAIGNLGKGFAALLMAFQPVATNMDKGLVTITQRFAQWASHLSATQGFKSFLNDVNHDGPLVLHIIGQIAVLANNLLRAMEPIGRVLLEMISQLLKWTNGMMNAHPWLIKLSGGIATFVGAFKLLGPLLGGAGPWGLLIAGIITGVMLIIAHWKQINTWAKSIFGETIPQMLRNLANVFQHVWFSIRNAVEAAWKFIEPTIMNAMKTISTYWRQIWPELKQVFMEVWDVLKPIIKVVMFLWRSEFDAFFAFIRGAWQPFWAAMGDVLKMAWDIIKGVLTAAWDVISGMFKVFLDLLTGQWGKAWNDFKSSLLNAWNAIKGLFVNFTNDAEAFGKNFVNAIIQGAESMASSMITSIGNLINRAKAAIGWGPSVSSNSKAGSAVTGGSSTSSSSMTITVNHSGSVTVAGMTPAAVQQVNQHLYSQTIRKTG